MLQRAAYLFVSLLLAFAGLVRGQERSTAAEATVLVPDAWMSHIQGNLAREEYCFSALDESGVWSAPNRPHGIRSRIQARGIEVFPRSVSSSGANSPWTLRLGTVSFGRGGEQPELDCLGLSVSGPRATLDHVYFAEFFQNSEKGIEQVWTVRTRPPGPGLLEIVLSIEGDLSMRIEESGTSGVFVDSSGEARLRYEGLRAVDGTSRPLVARFVPKHAGVVVEVADDAAVYPLVIESLLTNPAWTADGDQADALFGSCVSTAGDVNGDGYSDVIVGAPRYDNGEIDEGRAYAYYGSPSGLSSGQNWMAESNQTGAQFGTSVSTAGDVNGDGYSDVIVGAPRHGNGELNGGRAYIYHGSPSGLSTVDAWTAESNQADALFGTSVSTAGDVNGDGYSDVIVGAPRSDNGELDEGQAYVYHGSPSGISLSSVWIADGNQINSSFGTSVSTAGDVNADGYFDVIVGAHGYDNGEVNAGQAYVYHGSPAGLSAGSAWMAEATQPDSGFGFSVATAGDVNGDGYSDVIVGAYRFDDGEIDEGRALVFHGSAVGLSPSAAWTVDSDQAGAELGVSVSTAGDVNGDGYSDVLIGAGKYDETEVDDGRAFVYLGSVAGLAQNPVWMAESDQTGAQFGASVSTAGDVNGDGYSDVLIGAGLYDGYEYDADVPDAGRAYAYLGSGLGPPPGASWMAQGNQAHAGVGYSVSSAGDVNGDGYSDVVVSAYAYDNGHRDEGRVYVYHGSGDGLSPIFAWTAESNQASAYFGYEVATAGDVNGDGYSDVIIGALKFDNGDFLAGRAYVYHGSPTGLLSVPAWTAQPGTEPEISVSTAGDVNGDGYSDVIIGTPNESELGLASVYLGSAAGLSQSPAWTAQSEQIRARFGWSVATAGDVNGDGYSDVLVGASYFDNGAVDLNHGRAYAYYGSSTGLSTTAAWTTSPNEAQARFGASVASAGDVNGDGYSDVIVGAHYHHVGETNDHGGGAYVYLGSAAGLSTSAAWSAEAGQRFENYGFSVSAAGDVNGDGYSDVIVGASGSCVQSGEQVYCLDGRAYLYLGAASGLSAAASWTGESNAPEAGFGWSVAAAGDVNGDGYSDIIVGEPWRGFNQGLEGRAFLFLGNSGSGGLIRALQQRTWSNVRPISVYGLAGAGGRCILRAWFSKNLMRFAWATARRPYAWLEWEVKPFGQAFDGIGINRGAPQSLVPSEGTIVFNEMISLSSASAGEDGRLFHWRVRVATNNPLFPRTSWFSVPGSNITEAKLRGSSEASPRARRSR